MGVRLRITDSDVDVGCCPVWGPGDLGLELTKAVVDGFAKGGSVSLVELRRRPCNARGTCG